MFYVMHVFYDCGDRWAHVVAQFENEQNAENEADRLRSENTYTDISFEVVEGRTKMYTKRQILQLEMAGAIITAPQMSVEELASIRGILPDDLLDLMIKKAEIEQEIKTILSSYQKDNL